MYTLKNNDATYQLRLALYNQENFMGKERPGLAIICDEITEYGPEEYGILTVSFGEFIGLKNCACVDTNNIPDAASFFGNNAQKTSYIKHSGFCEYPLFYFSEDFLKEIDCDNLYPIYDKAYREEMGEDEEDDE